MYWEISMIAWYILLAMWVQKCARSQVHHKICTNCIFTTENCPWSCDQSGEGSIFLFQVESQQQQANTVLPRLKVHVYLAAASIFFTQANSLFLLQSLISALHPLETFFQHSCHIFKQSDKLVVWTRSTKCLSCCCLSNPPYNSATTNQTPAPLFNCRPPETLCGGEPLLLDLSKQKWAKDVNQSFWAVGWVKCLLGLCTTCFQWNSHRLLLRK